MAMKERLQAVQHTAEAKKPVLWICGPDWVPSAKTLAWIEEQKKLPKWAKLVQLAQPPAS
jgi:hypothetical protein